VVDVPLKQYRRSVSHAKLAERYKRISDVEPINQMDINNDSLRSNAIGQ